MTTMLLRLLRIIRLVAWRVCAIRVVATRQQKNYRDRATVAPRSVQFERKGLPPASTNGRRALKREYMSMSIKAHADLRNKS
jgi:hypothetical protein